MKENNKQLFRLLEKYRENDLTPKEYDELLKLIQHADIEEAVDRFAEADWKASGEILSRINARKAQARRRSKMAFLYIGAAVASALLVLSFLFFWPEAEPEYKPVVFETGFGDSRSISLPDGSTVLLNANSSLTWSGDWERKKKRSAIPRGEAFFEVQKADQLPFVVEAEGVEVKVLGTEFNVRNRRGEVDVFLSAGAIDLEIDELDESVIRMQPGDLVRYDSRKKELNIEEETGTISNRASWVTGMLSFQNEKLETILYNFEDLYGKHFLIRDSALLEKRLDLSLPYSNWALIREALEISLHVEFTEQQDTILVH